ncbi:MAG TPA: hypothetical protein GXZ26_06100 [Firmicutes bacterium]|jgi:hypothetical protein|nr:hypothetical protein [Bacillota bacterium]
MKARTGVILTTGVILAAVFLGYLLYTSFQPVSDLAQVFPQEKEKSLASSGSPSGSPDGDYSDTSHPALRLEQTEVTLVDQDNRTCWQLRIRTMEREGTAFALGKVTGEYFTPDGEVLAVQAKKGMLGADFSRLSLQEVVITGEKLAVNAGRMEWTTAPGGMLSGEEIVLKKQGIEVYADRFQTDPGLEKVVFDGQSRWKFPAR